MKMLTSLLFATMALGQAPVPAPAPKEPEKPVVDQPKETPKPAPKDQGPATPPQGTEPKGPEQKGSEQNGSEQNGSEPKPVDPKAQPQQGGGAPAEPQSADGKPKEAEGKDAPKSDQPAPRGADPADLAAIRSAEAMIEAEKKLSKLIREGKITGLDKVVTFDELSAWPYEDGLKGMPKRVKDLDGKKVLMSGFMLPIDEVQNIKEFLLVQSLWSCCYGQPPDINGIVRVVMPKTKTTDYFFDPLKVIGRFKVEATVIDGYCVDIYQLDVESIETLKDK